MSHPHVESILNLEWLDVLEVWRERFAVVDERRNNDPMGLLCRPELRFIFTAKHVGKLLGAPHAREVIPGPKRDQHTGFTERRSDRWRPGCAGLDLFIDIDRGSPLKLKFNPERQQWLEVVFDPRESFGISSIADEDIVLIAHFRTWRRFRAGRPPCTERYPIELSVPIASDFEEFEYDSHT